MRWETYTFAPSLATDEQMFQVSADFLGIRLDEILIWYLQVSKVEQKNTKHIYILRGICRFFQGEEIKIHF